MAILSLLGVWLTFAVACDPYKCDSKNFITDATACQTQDQGTYYLKVCSDGYTCDTSSGTCAFAPSPYPTAGFANINEACTYTIDCLHGGTCRNGHCQGKAKGESCTADEHCNKGLYCGSSDECVEMYDVGEAGCRTDFECVPQAGCDIVSGGTSGKCVQMYTGKPGTPVEYCDGEYADHNLCQSGKCWRNNGRKGICSSFIRNSQYNKNETETAYTCSSTCTSEVDPLVEKSAETSCECGENTDGLSYCQPFPGDKPAREYFEQLARWTASTAIQNCNARNEVGEPTSCMKTWWDPVNYARFNFYKTRLDSWTKVQSNDQCVRQIYTGSYWDSLNLYNDALANSITNKFLKAETLQLASS